MRMSRPQDLKLLTLGAGPRLVGAVLVIAAIWAAFAWATTPPGAS